MIDAPNELSPEDVDLSLRSFWSRSPADQQAAFAALRRDIPVSWQRPPEDLIGAMGPGGQDGYWALVRHHDVREVSRSPETFRSGDGVMFGEMPPEFQSFLAMDAPRHTSVRGLVQKAFSPRRVAAIEDRIRSDARRVVSDAANLEGGDFVELIAKRLPLMTVSDMLGLEEEEREPVADAADTLVAVADSDFVGDRDPVQLMVRNLLLLKRKAIALAADRAEAPRDDLMSALVHAEIGGQRLTPAEIGAFFVLLSIAGTETARNATAHGVVALQQFPEQRLWLLADLDARLPGAVEEIVRWASPVSTFRRTAAREVELHGQRIAEGDRVVLFYGSANRDESVFENPQRLCLDREPNPHVGFGGGGPHYCLGASLARTQLRSIFRELLTRLPDIELGEPEYLSSAFVSGIKRLPAKWSPGGG